MNHMRVLALDIGKVRVGVAVSDVRGQVASPVCVLSTDEVASGAPSWQRLLEDWEPELILAGLPLSLDGRESGQTKRIRSVAESIAHAAKLPLAFADERLSSAEAKRSLHESGLSEREMRGKVDMIAASLFLQSWLDGQNTSRGQQEAFA